MQTKEEKSKCVRLGHNLPEETYKKFKKACVDAHVTMNKQLQILIEEFLKKSFFCA